MSLIFQTDHILITFLFSFLSFFLLYFALKVYILYGFDSQFVGKIIWRAISTITMPTMINSVLWMDFSILLVRQTWLYNTNWLFNLPKNLYMFSVLYLNNSPLFDSLLANIKYSCSVHVVEHILIVLFWKAKLLSCVPICLKNSSSRMAVKILHFLWVIQRFITLNERKSLHHVVGQNNMGSEGLEGSNSDEG